MTDTKIPMRIFTSYEALTEYYGERPDMELGLYVSDEKLLVGHAPTAYSFNPQYFTDNNELMSDYVPESLIDYTITATSNNTTYGYVTGGGTYPEHTEITVNAYAYYGYKFDKWSNDVETSAYTFAVEEDADLTANFEEDPYAEPFYVENITNENETLSIAKSNNSAPLLNIEYSSDKQTWNYLGSTSTTALTYTLQPGEKLYLRCETDTGWGVAGTDGHSNRISGCSKVGGNIMSLIYGSNFTGSETTFKNNTYQTFRSLFDSNSVLEDAKDLLLPATTLVPSCYRAMFGGCTSLTTAPVLPATNLAEYCYRYMFYNTKITVAPTLPATTLAKGCYYQMLQQTSIITAPVLPATNLADECYYYMFTNCTSLTTAPELPATTLTSKCYYQMFAGCTSLTTAPVLPATTLAIECYRFMFQNCSSLTTAPELPATTLTSHCYFQMFSGCTLINKIKCLATDISASYATKSWLFRTSETGTFTKAAGVEWPTGISGIPEGWTVVEEAVS